MKLALRNAFCRFVGLATVCLLAVPLAGHAAVAEDPDNDPEEDPPKECESTTATSCDCESGEDTIENGCVLVTLDLGATTPWTGAMPVRLKIHTRESGPSLSTPEQLKLVLGYTLMKLGSDRTSAGAPATVEFAEPAGRTVRFRFAEGSSVGVPLLALPADGNVRLQMVDAEGWATLSAPAFYDLHPGDGSVWRYSASPAAPDFGALVCKTDPRGVVRTWEDMGVTVLRDAAGRLRQVATRTRLADIVADSDTHYAVTVFPLAGEPAVDPDTGLLVPPALAPVRVLDVRRGASEQELFVGLRKGTGDIRTYRYEAKNGDWELTLPSGLVDARELYYNADETGAVRLHLVRDASGALLRRTERSYADRPWGWALTNKVEGLDGELKNVTSWSYVADGPNQGKVADKTEPNGNRIVYEYDAQNRVVRESMPLVEEETLYSYEPVDPSDPPLLCDTRPRCVVRKMQGVEIRRTYYVYGTNGVDVVERVGEQGAAYGGTNVLRTVTTYYPVTGAVTDGLVKSVRHEDGIVDDYAYDLAGGVWTETVTHVHEQAPDIVPMRTTRSVRVYNALGRLVDSRTDLCTAGVEDLVPQADWTPIERLQYAYDIDGNEIRREDLAGRLWTAEWAGNCCGKVSETDWQGITTTYAYDAEGRVVARQAGSILTATAYDTLGRATNVTRRGIATADRPAATVHPSSFVYDSLGRLLTREGGDGIRRVYAYAYRPEGGEIRTVTEAPETDCERVLMTVSDSVGRTVRELRNGTLRRSFLHAPLLEIVYEGSKGTNSPVWTAMESDLLDRVTETRKPGFGGAVLHSRNAFDASGNTVEIEDGYTSAAPGFAPVVTSRRLSSFETFGDRDPVLSAEDVNRNGLVDFTGPDVVVSNSVDYIVQDGLLWRESSQHSFPDTNSAEPLRMSASRVRLTRLGAVETTELGAANIVADTQTVDVFGNIASQRSFVDRSSSRFFVINDAASSILSAWNLSINGLAVSNRTATGVISSRTYDALGRMISTTDGRGNTTTLAYDATGRLADTTDATGATTAYGYDALGRQTSVTNALGLVITTTYDLDGNVVSQRGAQYPVDYIYDEYGRMATMTTYRTEDLTHGDATTWHYDEATGLLVFKEYADGKGPTYDYTPDGRLARRTWVRGISTDYAYDALGNLVSLDYSDETPDITYTRDRLGNVLSVVCIGVSTNLYAYSRLGQLTNEVQNGTTIVRSYDTLGRETGYAIGDGVAAGSATLYAYDELGRFSAVSSKANVFSYSYLPGSDLVSGMTANTGHAWERIYEPDRDLIATVHNRYGARTISRFDYTNDELGRRVARVDSGEAFSESACELYSYNDRSEVVGSQRFFGSDLSDRSRLVPNRSFGYSYDPIGNRLSSTEDSDRTPVVTLYESNELNQYVQNSNAVSLTAFEYDADGNMTFDGRFRYSWNGENRMIRAEEAVVPTNRAPTTITYAYEEHGRMITKIITGTNTIARSLLWDGYNIVRETDNGVSTYNIWGLDLDGTLQGCGGVGGLLAVAKTNGLHIALYDANGNVSDYVSATGSISDHYEYSPFGESLVLQGESFTHQFSTKPYCILTGLSEYQLRKYNSTLGRWISRDMIEENGAVNLYLSFQNHPIGEIDLLGNVSFADCWSLCVTYWTSQVYQLIKRSAEILAALDALMELPVGQKVLQGATIEKLTSLGNKLSQSVNKITSNPHVPSLVAKAAKALGDWAKTSGTMKWLPGIRSNIPAVRRAAKISRNGLRAARGGIVGLAGSMVFLSSFCAGQCCFSDMRDYYQNLLETSPDDFLFGED